MYAINIVLIVVSFVSYYSAASDLHCLSKTSIILYCSVLTINTNINIIIIDY